MVSVNWPQETYYGEGHQLEFTIHGLPGLNPPGKEVKVGMPIFLGEGFGWPWACDERVVKNMPEEEEDESTIRWGTGEFGEDGLLHIEGVIGPDEPCQEPPCPDLPYGELNITLPDYGRFIDHVIRLRPVGCDHDADVGVYVGFAVSVVGEGVVGETLHATDIKPDSAEVQYEYQWMRCDEQWAPDDAYAEIEDATAATYKLTDDDWGKYIKVRVTRPTENCELYVLSLNEIGPVVRRIEGLDVEARTEGQLELGDWEKDEEKGLYALSPKVLVDIEDYENGVGETGKWVGLQLKPIGVTDITELEYKTAKTDGFKLLTEADATEAGEEGEIVWWVDAGTKDPQGIELRYAGDINPEIWLKVTFELYEEPQEP